MIPRAEVTEWRATVPWAFDQQIEQDLVISRALVELFSEPSIKAALAFRGGTALHKLFFKPPGRYSEDIDLVQIAAGPIGPLLDTIHDRLDTWLGDPAFKQTERGSTFSYRFTAETEPATKMRLKVEINTREHEPILGVIPLSFSVVSRWFTGTADITTYKLEELLGTKLRALYQRRKGRDVFDLSRALELEPRPDVNTIVECFLAYMKQGGHSVSRVDFQKNLAAKRKNHGFMTDVIALLPATAAPYDQNLALEMVERGIIALLP